MLKDVRAGMGISPNSTPWSAEEATMERMGAMMAENGCKLIGLFDEFTHFLSQLNIYRGKAITDSQDLAMLLQLYNGFSWSRKTGKFERKPTLFDMFKAKTGHFKGQRQMLISNQ